MQKPIILTVFLVFSIQAAPWIWNSRNGGRNDFIHERSGYFEGDIIMSYHSRIAGAKYLQWTNRQIPFYIDSSISREERSAVENAISHINSKTCIRLKPRTSEANYIKFSRSGSGCFSYVGMQVGEQIVGLNSGCFGKRTIVHEILHAIGFWHEQSRNIRDKHVNINWENIPEGSRNNFDKHGNTNDDGYPYDFKSIMHYSSHAFSSNGQPTITSKTGFPSNQFGSGDGRGGMSNSDASQINKMYNCNSNLFANLFGAILGK